MRNRERNESSGRGTQGRLQRVIALLLLAAAMMSLGGFAFAAEPVNVSLSPDETSATTPTPTPAETATVSPDVTPTETPPAATSTAGSTDASATGTSTGNESGTDKDTTPTPTPTPTPDTTPAPTPTPTPTTSPNGGEDGNDGENEGDDKENENENTKIRTMLLGATPDAPATVAETGSIPVYFYVAENGAWKLLHTGESEGTALFDKNNRYYVTASTLVSIYGVYGFTAESITSETDRIFPHTESKNPNIVYADAAPMKKDVGGVEQWLVPLVGTNTNNASLYYLPTNKSGITNYFTTYKSTADVLANNNFYTITVNPNGMAEDESATVKEQKALVGNNVTVTLPKLVEGAYWRVTDGKASITPPSKTDNADGTTSYTITNINSPYVFTAQNQTTIEYDARVDRTGIGSNSSIPTVVGDDGKVNGMNVYTVEYTGAESHTVLNIDIGSDVVTTTINAQGKDVPIRYTFTGWTIGNGTELIKPDTVLTEQDITAAKDTNGIVKLTAQWTPYIDGVSNDYIATANFYIGKNVEIHGDEFNYTATDVGSYTNSLYTSRVIGEPQVAKPGAGQVDFIKAGKTATEANKTDKTIREAIYKKFQGIELIDRMPSDEDVLRYLRESKTDVLTMEDHEMQDTSILTPDRFGVRWFVVKYDVSDGFHVDGVVYAKPAELVVQKTFSGDSATVNSVKNNFFISVEHDVEKHENGTNVSTGEHKLDYKLVLTPDDGSYGAEDGYEDKIGYTDYDPQTDTYTWVLQGFQGVNYQIIEKNYEKPQTATDITRDSTYRLINQRDEADEGGNYDEKCVVGKAETEQGVFVRMRAYNEGTPYSDMQTVILHNGYTKPGVITVEKKDAMTDGHIGNVQFTLSGANGKIPLFQKLNTPEYSTKQDKEVYTSPAEYAKTDEHGHFFIELDPGNYTLTETIPGGYFGAESVSFTVSENNTISAVTWGDVSEGAPARDESSPWARVDTKNNKTLIVDNRSRTFGVTVTNKWLTDDEAKNEKVTIELLRNGTSLGEDYIIELNGTESQGWTKTWDDMPLFVNGAVANYTVKVSKIGSVYYSDILGVTDGFENYSVTRDPAVYSKTTVTTEAGGNVTQKVEKNTSYWHDETDNTKIHYADHLDLVVKIKPIEGELAIKKVMDETGGYGLPDAVFGLYRDETCSEDKRITTLTSDEGGVLSMSGIAAGTYYLKEISAPVNFAVNGSVYKVRVTGGAATVTKYKDASGSVLVNGDPLYNFPLTDLINETSLTLHVQNRTVEEGEAVLYGAEVKLERVDGDKPETIKTFKLTNGDDRDDTVTLGRGLYRVTQTTVVEGYELYKTGYDFRVENGQLIPVIELMTLALERAPGWYPGINEDESFLLTVFNKPEESETTPGEDDDKTDKPDEDDKTEPSPSPTVSPAPTTTPAPTATPTPGTIWWHSPYGYGGLPQTGQVNWPVPVLAALGAALIAAGLIMSRSARKRAKR